MQALDGTQLITSIQLSTTFNRAASTILALLAGPLILAGFYRFNFAAGSVDVAGHYGVVDHYLDWSPIQDLAMSLYPHGAHALAAAVALVFRLTPFFAMHLVSIAALYLIYFLLFSCLARCDFIITLLASIALMVAVLAMRPYWAVYGFEIIGNYFFAQVVGEAAFLAATLFFCSRPRTVNDLWLMPAVVFVLGAIYQLDQIKLAAATMLLWVIYILRDWLTLGVIDRKKMWQFIILTILLAAAIVLKPGFLFMVAIARTGGGIGDQIGSLYVVQTCIVVLLALGVANLILALRLNRTMLLFVAAISIATAVVAELQSALHVFGFSSDYAVRKHTFAIVTLNFVAALNLLIEASEVWTSRYIIATDRLVRPLISSGFATVTVAWLLYIYMADRTAFLAYQNEVRLQPQLRGITISKNNDYPAEFNFLVTVGDLRAYPSKAVHEILGLDVDQQGRPDPEFVIVSNHTIVPAACIVPNHNLLLSQLMLYNCK